MKRLYNEFFRISKNEKIREKVLVTRVAVIVTTIVFCLAAMSLSAYAHFSYNVSSKTNIISVSNFEVSVLVDVVDNEDNVIETVTPEATNYKQYTAAMQTGKTYRITIKHTDNSTAKTGFMVIKPENFPNSFHTVQIGRNDDGTSKAISFKMEFTADTQVEFLTHWGTSVYYDAFMSNGEDSELYVTEGEKISVNVSNVNEQPQNNEEKQEAVISDEIPSTQNSSQPLMNKDEAVSQSVSSDTITSTTENVIEENKSEE